MCKVCDEIMDYWENMVTKLWEHDEIMEPYWRNYGNFLIISSFWLWSFQTLISPLKIHLRLFKYYQIKAKKISYPVVYNKQQFLYKVRQESCGNAKGVEIMRTHGRYWHYFDTVAITFHQRVRILISIYIINSVRHCVCPIANYS